MCPQDHVSALTGLGPCPLALLLSPQLVLEALPQLSAMMCLLTYTEMKSNTSLTSAFSFTCF